MAITYKNGNRPPQTTIKAIQSSIPLILVDKSKCKPCDLAGGCFLFYKQNMFFLSVLHNFKDMPADSQWAIKGECSEENGTQLFYINDSFRRFLRFEAKQNRTNEIRQALGTDCIEKHNRILKSIGAEDIDFVYKRMNFIELPISAYFVSHKSRMEGDDSIYLDSEKNIYLSDDLNVQPDVNEEYFFAENVKPGQRHDQITTLSDGSECYERLQIYYSGLKYVCGKNDDDYLIFKIDMNISPEYLKGFSGSPILDSKGNLISLVIEYDCVKSDIKTYGSKYKGQKDIIIKGVNLQKYKIDLDIECGLIT